MTTTEKSFKKGYKFRIYPTETQKELLAKTFGCCRYLWNTVLAETQKEYQDYILTKENNTLDTMSTPNVSGNALGLRVPTHYSGLHEYTFPVFASLFRHGTETGQET